MTVNIPCKACFATGCPACLNRGRVQGFCACTMPGDVLCDITALCFACAAACVLCDQTTDAADRTPFDGCGFAHAICAIEFAADAARFLEAPRSRVDSCGTPAMSGTAPKRTRRSEMPRMSLKNIEVMRVRGLISIAEAARITGHNKSTFYGRIRKGTLGPPLRSGVFLYIPIESLVAAYPHIAEQLKAAALPQAEQAA